MDTSVQERYHQILEAIARTARSAGREPEDVHLVVVTKGHPAEVVQAVVEAGARRLGENYAEEALPKIQAVSGQAGVEWHMIGHIQSRKASLVCGNFHYVHSVDSLKLARRLDRCMGEGAGAFPAGTKLPVLLECNVSGEESKYGFPAWQENAWALLLPDFEEITCLPNLEVRGLMAMAPFFSTAEPARPFFRRLRQLQAFLSRQLPKVNWGELSMGMSGDYQVAIQEGAVWVRIGTAILGSRSQKG